MRTILFVLALLGATVGRGQIFLDWYSSAAPAAGLLLDDYPNAAAAYSLRLLNSAYTGNCIEVRRSNDNALQNIGFAGGVLDTAALKTFCGANNCFVRTWYDQSGNGRHVLQTTNANQPQIVASGVVHRAQGIAGLSFSSSSRIFTDSAFFNNQTNVYSASVFATTATFTNGILLSLPSGNGPNRGYDVRFPTSTTIQSSILTSTSTTNANGTFNYSSGNVTIIEAQYNSAVTNGQQIYGNNSLIGQTTNTGGLINNGANGGLCIGFFGTVSTFGFNFQGTMFEHIFYTTNQSSNRSGIYSNIDSAY